MEGRKWYFKTSIVVTAFLLIGPLALPLVWWNPHYSRKAKIIVTLVTVAATYYMTVATIHSIKLIMTYYDQAFKM